MNAILTGIVSGIGVGAIYVLTATSFTLALLATGVFNFAQGTLVMLGAVFAFFLSVILHWPWLGIIAAILAGGTLLGLFTHLVAIAPVARRATHLSEAAMITTLGLGLAAESLTQKVFGADPQVVPSYVSTTPWSVGGIPIRPVYVVMVVVTAAVVIGLELMMRTTSLGTVLRATLEDSQGASLAGINTVRVVAGIFALAGTLSALAGFLVAPVSFASPFLDANIALFAFAAMGVGGFGSFSGALVGGLVVGIIGGVVPVVLDTHATTPVLFIVLVVVLLLRPTGLFGQAGFFGNVKLREI
jgi:branched-subunit amino acid ABC-type transport system permease component